MQNTTPAQPAAAPVHSRSKREAQFAYFATGFAIHVVGWLLMLLGLILHWFAIEWEDSSCSNWTVSLINGMCIHEFADDDDQPSGCYGFHSDEVKTVLPFCYDERNSVFGAANHSMTLAVIVCGVCSLVYICSFGSCLLPRCTVVYVAPPLSILAGVLSMVSYTQVFNSDCAEASEYKNASTLQSFQSYCGTSSVRIHWRQGLGCSLAGAIFLFASTLLLCFLSRCRPKRCCCWICFADPHSTPELTDAFFVPVSDGTVPPGQPQPQPKPPGEVAYAHADAQPPAQVQYAYYYPPPGAGQSLAQQPQPSPMVPAQQQQQEYADYAQSAYYVHSATNPMASNNPE